MTEEQKEKGHLAQAYERLIERANELMEEVSEKAEPTLHHLLEEGRAKAVKLGELTEKEAKEVADYLRHDLHDAAIHLMEKERDLADSLRLEALVKEKEYLKRFSNMVELAKLELKHASHDVQHPLQWHTGEITGIGTLACSACGKEVHFGKPGHIPPCPGCHGTVFQRRWRE